MGSLEGEIIFKDNIATYKTTIYDGGICQLTFELKDQKMIVEYIGKDVECGFGGGVYANGEYVKTSVEPPAF